MPTLEIAVDAHYVDPRLAALYDIGCGWSIERDFYVRFAGPATNTAALTTLWKVLGRRAAILYLITVAVASLATGLAVDGLIGAGGCGAGGEV